MLSALDSYFEYVAARFATINPARQVVGIMDAQDWPAKPIALEGFYLLTMGQRPIGKSFHSAAVPVLGHSLQWTWIISGTDLQTGKVGRGRGDKYRTNMTMKEELLKASWPWYAEKKSWSVQGNTPAGLALLGTSLTPPEFIWWSDLSFMNRVDRASGVIYGTATLYLTDMDATTIS